MSEANDANDCKGNCVGCAKMEDGTTWKLNTKPVASPNAKTTTIIKALPPEVIAQIKSSTTITSLTGTIIGLLKNSLDAASTKVNIEVDFTRGSCTLTDNGHGIPPAEFTDSGGLCKLYHTSRYALSSNTYGTNGTFLASLSALCLLTVTSKHEKHYSTNSLIVHHAKVKSRLIPAPAAHRLEGNAQKGTRIVVRVLFGNMAVRVKQRGLLAEDTGELEKLWDELKAAVVALLVAFATPITIHLRDSATGKKLNLTPPSTLSDKGAMLSAKQHLALSLLRQAGKISVSNMGPVTWIPVSASSSALTIKGLLSLQPSPSKGIQYLSLGALPLDKSTHPSLYEHINRLFAHSCFGALPEEELDEAERERRKYDRRFKVDGLTRKQMLVEKGVERWPMFVLGVEFKDGGRKAEEVVESEGLLGRVVKVLDALVVGWLEANHFKVRRSGGKETVDGRPWMIASDDARPQTASSLRTASGRQSTPIKSARPYTGVTSMNALSRVKSSHGMGFATPDGKLSRPGTAPSVVPAKRPIIDVEPIVCQWPAKKQNEKVMQNVMHQSDHSTPVEAQTHLEISAEDEYIDWTDPVTKQTHRLNARTGMRMPDARPEFPHDNTNIQPPTARGKARPITRIALPSRPQPTTTPQPRTEWLDSMLQAWDNPVFRTREASILQASFDLPTVNEACKHIHMTTNKEMNRAFGEVSTFNESTISKAELRDAEVIGQVDEKFLLVRVTGKKELLVAIDQHAADERVKVEGLLRELCTLPGPTDICVISQTSGLKSGVKTTVLEKAVRFSISAQEMDLFGRHAPHFAAWGILYDTHSKMDEHHLSILTLPPLISERCTSEPKLLISLLRTELWKREESGSRTTSTIPPPAVKAEEDDGFAWIKKIRTCPTQILEMANSRACRSAIMFNDRLTVRECGGLVEELATCAFPFVCAHGRPSLVPLIELGGLGDIATAWEGMGMGSAGRFGGKGEESGDYATAFGRWRSIEGVGGDGKVL